MSVLGRSNPIQPFVSRVPLKVLLVVTPANISATVTVSGVVQAKRKVAVATINVTATPALTLQRAKIFTFGVINATGTMTGAVQAQKRVTTGTINAVTIVSGAIAKQAKAIVPATVNVTAPLSGVVVKQALLRTGTINATSTVTGTVIALRVIKPAVINTTTVVYGNIRGCTDVTSAIDTNNLSSRTVTITPAVGDLIIIFTETTGYATDPGISDNNADGLGTYTKIRSQIKHSSADKLSAWVRNAPIGNSSSTVFTMTMGSNTGSGLHVMRWHGYHNSGLGAIRQSTGEDNQGSSQLGATFGSTPLASSGQILAVLSEDNPADNSVEPVGWNERVKTGYNTPTTGILISTVDDGSTATKPETNNSSPSAYCDILVELNAGSTPVVPGTINATATVSGTVTRAAVFKAITPASISVITATSLTRVAIARPITPATINVTTTVYAYLLTHWASFVDATTTFDTSAGNKTVTKTPSVDDLIIIIAATSGLASAPTITDDNPDGLGAYTQIRTQVKLAGADMLSAWVRNSLVSNSASTIFTMAPGTDTGGGLTVLRFSGMSKAGSAAIKQSAGETNQIGGSLPAPHFGSTTLPNDALIEAIFSTVNPPDSSLSPTGWTERVNVGYNTPTSALEVATVDKGQEITTPVYPNSVSNTYCDLIIELDASGVVRAVTPATINATGTLSGGLVGRKPATPATINATASVSGLVARRYVVPVAAISATGTVSGSVAKQKVLAPATINVTAAVGGFVFTHHASFVDATTTFNTNTGVKTATVTPSVDDLIVIIAANSGITNDPTIVDSNLDGLGTYTKVTGATKTASDGMTAWVRNALIGVSASTIFTMTPGAVDTGGGLIVLRFSGLDRAGSAVIKQSAIENNQIGGSHPAPALGSAPGASDALISAIFESNNPATASMNPSGWTEQVRTGYSAPTTGIEVSTLDYGSTNPTPTFGSAGNSYGDLLIELDASGLTKAITPATINVTGTLSGSVARTKAITPASISASAAVSGLVRRARPVVPAVINVRTQVRGFGPLVSYIDSYDGEISPPGDFILTPGSACGDYATGILIIQDNADKGSYFDGTPLAFVRDYGITGNTPSSSDPFGGAVSPFNHHFYLQSRAQGKINEYNHSTGAGIKQVGHGSHNQTGGTHTSGGTQNEVDGYFTSTLAASFVQPSVGSTVTIQLDDTSWIPANNFLLYVYGGGFYYVQSITDSTHLVAKNTGYFGGASVAATVPSGGLAVPGGIGSADGLLIDGSGNLHISDSIITNRITVWAATGAFIGFGYYAGSDETRAMTRDGGCAQFGSIYDPVGGFIKQLPDENGGTIPGASHSYIPPTDANNHIFSTYWDTTNTPGIAKIWKHTQAGVLVAVYYINIAVAGVDGHTLYDFNYLGPNQGSTLSIYPFFVTDGNEQNIFFIPGNKNAIYKYSLTETSGLVALRRVAPAQINVTTTTSITKLSVARPIVPAGISASASVSGIVTLKGLIKPATINATAAVSVTKVTRLARVVPATINASAAVSLKLTALKLLHPASISVTAPLTGTVKISRAILVAAINTTATMSGSLVYRKAIPPAQINVTAAVSGTVTRLPGGRFIQPTVAINTTATMSGTVIALHKVIAAGISVTATVSAQVVTKRAIFPAQINTTVTVSSVVVLRHLVITPAIIVTGTVTMASIVEGRAVLLGQINTTTAVSLTRVTSLRAIKPAGITATATVSGAVAQVGTGRAITPAGITATITMSGGLVQRRILIPAGITATASVSGVVVTKHRVSAVINTTVLVSGTLVGARRLIGIINVSVAISGSIGVTRGFVFGQIHAGCTVSVAVSIKRLVVPAQIAVTTTVSSTVTVGGIRAIVPAGISVTVAVSSRVSVRRLVRFGVVNAGVSVSLTIARRFIIHGAITASATVSATLVYARALNLTVNAGATVSGIVIELRLIRFAVINARAIVSGTVTLHGMIFGPPILATVTFSAFVQERHLIRFGNIATTVTMSGLVTYLRKSPVYAQVNAGAVVSGSLVTLHKAIASVISINVHLSGTIYIATVHVVPAQINVTALTALAIPGPRHVIPGVIVAQAAVSVTVTPHHGLVLADIHATATLSLKFLLGPTITFQAFFAPRPWTASLPVGKNWSSI